MNGRVTRSAWHDASAPMHVGQNTPGSLVQALPTDRRFPLGIKVLALMHKASSRRHAGPPLGWRRLGQL